MVSRISDDVIDMSNNSEWIITSRIDNDDIILNNYIAEIQRNINYQHGNVVNFNKGICYNFNENYFTKYMYDYLQSPFVSKIEESKKGCRPILLDHHDKLTPNQQIDVHGWIQLIHGDNLRNTLNGEAVFKSELKVINSDILLYENKLKVIFLKINKWFSKLTSLSYYRHRIKTFINE